MNLNENPIDVLNTTQKLRHMLNKNYLFLLTQPLNLITYHLINAWGDENHIITYSKFVPVPHEGILHDYIMTFHVYDELEQALIWGELSWSPKHNVTLAWA
jgi:hypothetical protein